jgi:hypothetical protein
MSPGSAGVIESRSFYPTTAKQGASSSATSGAKVGFWNLSARDVTLQVSGKTHYLKAGQSLKLDLPRRFLWKVGDREIQTEEVPNQVPGVEIVIRR